ncbi:hypothetical protein CBS101457_006501 [Exobasidium rhododendri]|nr:hypothetical protein CBS101457_006501 [Exobasidium rhododendri]
MFGGWMGTREGRVSRSSKLSNRAVYGIHEFSKDCQGTRCDRVPGLSEKIATERKYKSARSDVERKGKAIRTPRLAADGHASTSNGRPSKGKEVAFGYEGTSRSPTLSTLPYMEADSPTNAVEAVIAEAKKHHRSRSTLDRTSNTLKKDDDRGIFGTAWQQDYDHSGRSKKEPSDKRHKSRSWISKAMSSLGVGRRQARSKAEPAAYVDETIPSVSEEEKYEMQGKERRAYVKMQAEVERVQSMREREWRMDPTSRTEWEQLNADRKNELLQRTQSYHA